MTDANAACMRFAGQFPEGPVVPQNPDEYALFLTRLGDAYEQLATELADLTPPPDLQADLAALDAELQPRIDALGLTC